MPSTTSDLASESVWDKSVSDLPAVSVVVPVYNSGRTLRACLQSIRDQVGVAVELIVVDPDKGSTDDTPEIAGELADLFLVTGSERVEQRNAGLARASHPVIAFIDSDMVLEPGVLVEAVSALSSDECGGVVVDEEIVGEGFWIAGRRLEKRLYRGDPAAEAGRVFRTEEVRAVGGYDPLLDMAEDFDLSDRVVAARRMGRTRSVIFHDEGRIRLRALWAKKVYYGTQLRGFLRSALVDGPEGGTRHRLWRRSLLKIPAATLRHPRAGVALIVLKTVEFTALAWGVVRGHAAASRLRDQAYPPAYNR